MSQGMAASQTLKPIAVGLLIALAGVGYLGCDKDEPPPPLPAAAPPSVAQTPQPVVEVQPEDAGVADAAEDADASKRTGGSPAGLMACCKALEQNAESAPEPNKTHMKNFAATCKMAAGAGQVQGVNLALRMAGLPSCK